jgi:hypothetical protein
MTLQEMRAAEEKLRQEFEARTVAFLAEGRPVTMAEARAVFERYHHTPGTDWKRPVDARRVPRGDLVVFMQAVRFYHGCAAFAVCASQTFADHFRVTGPGYSC